MTPNDEHSNEHTVPHRWEADVVLYEGYVAVVRPVPPHDIDALKSRTKTTEDRLDENEQSLSFLREELEVMEIRLDH